jgi:hypothetical protein
VPDATLGTAAQRAGVPLLRARDADRHRARVRAFLAGFG